MQLGYFKVKEVASLRPIFTHTRIHPWADMTGKPQTFKGPWVLHLFKDSRKSIKRFQARIQEFSSGGGGGSNLPENFDKQKKKNHQKKKKTKGAGGFPKKNLFCLSLVEIYFCNWNSFQGNNFHKYDLPPVILFLHTKTHLRFSMVKCVSYVTVRGGSGGPPPENFWF